jgi:hypothetical protein
VKRLRLADVLARHGGSETEPKSALEALRRAVSDALSETDVVELD